MRLIVLCGGWLLGLYLGSRLEWPLPVVAGLLPASGVTLFVVRRHWRPLLAVVFAIGLFAGALRFNFHEQAADSETLAALNGEGRVELRGIVASYPERFGPVTRFDMAAREVLVAGERRPVSGKVRVTARETPELVRLRDAPYFRPGDVLLLQGSLEAPASFGDFDFPTYLSRQGVGSVMTFPSFTLEDTGRGSALRRGLFAVRSRLSESLESVLPEPQNAVGQAILLGIRTDLSSDLTGDFHRSGTSHLLAISGLHVGIVMVLVLGLSRRLLWRPRWLVLLIPAAAIWLYALAAGLPPSAERAAIMGSFFLAALYFGRQRHGIEALLLAGLVITAFDPRALWQVSFQLSFLAMAGIVLTLPALSGYVNAVAGERAGLPGTFVRGVVALTAMSVVATLFTLPALAFYFERVSLVSVPATVLALPMLPVALAFTAATAVVGLVSTDAAWVFAWVAWAALGYVVWVVQLFASSPLSSVRIGGFGRGLALAYIGGLFGAVLVLRNRWVRIPRALSLPALPVWPEGWAPTRFGVAAVAIAAAALLVWGAAIFRGGGDLDVVFLDVGHGDSILVRTPSEHTVLVDGGRDPRPVIRQLDERLPFWDRRIDLVVMTHPDEDHVGGLPQVLERYDVGAVLDSGFEADTGSYAAWRGAIDRLGLPRIVAREGQSITLGDVAIEVLHPPKRHLAGTEADSNNNSVVLRVSYGEVSFLLTGDVFELAEEYLLARDAPVGSTVLKIAHHGSSSSSGDAFLEAVLPEVAVISAAVEDPFGHPHDATLTRLRRHVPEETLFMTSRDGAVRLRTDGRRLWVETER